MKIICATHNYPNRDGETTDGIQKEERGLEPSFYLKPDSALLHKGMPFFYPEFSQQIECGIGIVVRIEKVGKSIAPRYAHRYYHSIALGVSFVAKDLLVKAQRAGNPWLLSEGFDGAMAIGDFYRLDTMNKGIEEITYSLQINGEECQRGNTQSMQRSVDEMISYLSDYMILRTGDLLFTGMPSDEVAVSIGDVLTGTIEDEMAIRIKIK